MQSRRAERGIALIAVLSLLALLCVLALAVLDSSRRHGQLVQRSIESYQAQEIADSAIRLTLLELSAPGERGVAQTAQPERSYDIFGRRVTVSYRSERERIDLNAADEAQLTAAFAANGFTEPAAAAFAQRIIDWRDVDDAPRAAGAERAEYRNAGRTAGPRNAPFETVNELREVLGLQSVREELLDAFTVYSPEPVQSIESGHVMRLRACASAGPVEQCRIAVVRLTGNWSRPIQIYVWFTQHR